MKIPCRILVLLLVSTPVFAQFESLAEEDQIRAQARLESWKNMLEERNVIRRDFALFYLDNGNEKLQEAIRTEVGIPDEELEQWKMQNAETNQSLNEKLKPLGQLMVAAGDFETFDAFLAEADALVWEHAEQIQAQVLENIGPERLAKLRKLGLQLQSVWEGGAIDFNSYEYLDLSEDQKKRLAEIRSEYIQAHDLCAREISELTEQAYLLILQWDTKSEEERKAGEAALGERMANMEVSAQKTVQKFRKVAEAGKVKISALLTDAQAERLETIIAETPDWIKTLGPSEAKTQDDSWRDAWKPGDPVPEREFPTKKRKVFPSLMSP